MRFLAHRGLWVDVAAKNTHDAFLLAATEGFGIETDVRDSCGRLVISHDMPTGNEISFEEFLELYQISCRYEDSPLAINIKSDGLASEVAKELAKRPGLNAFVFDMSVPDMKGYFNNNVPVFTRFSEIETHPVWLDKSSGVWLDSFEVEWFTADVINKLLASNLIVCVVSPELHGRPHLNTWDLLKKIPSSDKLWLCTDFPQEAREFFREDRLCQ